MFAYVVDQRHLPSTRWDSLSSNVPKGAEVTLWRRWDTINLYSIHAFPTGSPRDSWAKTHPQKLQHHSRATEHQLRQEEGSGVAPIPCGATRAQGIVHFGCRLIDTTASFMPTSHGSWARKKWQHMCPSDATRLVIESAYVQGRINHDFRKWCHHTCCVLRAYQFDQNVPDRFDGICVPLAQR